VLLALTSPPHISSALRLAGSYDVQRLREGQTTTRVMAIANQKGGVGKTTTAVSLAACLSVSERRTLLVDLDPQGNATTGLGVDKSGSSQTIYDVLLSGGNLREVVRPTALPFLEIAASDINLVGAEIELVTAGSRETRLRDSLGDCLDRFEYVIVDCPPSLGLLTLNALTAATSVLIPVQCEFYALEGLTHLLRTIELVRERLNPGLETAGILLTMFDGRTSVATQIKDQLQKYFAGQIFRTVIPRNVRLAEAPSHGRPVITYDVRSSGSLAYLELTREVLGHD
jgi:chromosome partitioning protein